MRQCLAAGAANAGCHLAGQCVVDVCHHHTGAQRGTATRHRSARARAAASDQCHASIQAARRGSRGLGISQLHESRAQRLLDLCLVANGNRDHFFGMQVLTGHALYISHGHGIDLCRQ